ncbi:GPI mannosyltransferase 2 [Anopheles bellator]|uniref:GPI mannosyltransferase 2 n=1 Tax=Anopheles bellator TaxID=139047 RepID=UPI002649687B|nr:GPI mannosyltransferase 2 [Anopheles bellator]
MRSGSSSGGTSPKRRTHHHHVSNGEHHQQCYGSKQQSTAGGNHPSSNTESTAELPPSSGSFFHISIVKLALVSRLLVIVLQIVANQLLPDHDAGVFVAPRDTEQPERPLDKLVRFAFGGLERWDAQYFLHIAEHGYTYENTLAFFPLFPFILKIIGSALSSTDLATLIGFRELSLLLAVLLNMVCFTGAACAMYKLSKLVLGSKKKAEVAVLLFCFNPASIFFTAPYSESLYACLSFIVMYQCVEDVNLIFIAMPLSLSLLCRSNGMMNIGFVLYFVARRIVAHYNFHNVICICSRLFSVLMIVLFHYGIAQVYNYYLFCFEQKFNFPPHVRTYATDHGLVLAGNKTNDSSPWCTSAVPLSYSYVQSHYWNVGLLRYYELKQLPNFLLALPAIYLTLSNSYRYLHEHWDYAARLGLFRLPKRHQKIMRPYDRLALVFVIHAVALTVVSLLFVHVQVTTRLLCSSSPILYWYAAEYFTGERAFIKRQVIRKLSKQHAILLYFVGYTVIGTVLFSNFYPWT